MKWIKRLFKTVPKIKDKPVPETDVQIDPNVKAILEIRKFAEDMDIHPCIRVILWTLIGAAHSSPEVLLAFSLLCQTYSQAMLAQINKTESISQPNIVIDGNRSIH